MSDPDRHRRSTFASVLEYICLFLMFAVIVTPSHVFAGTKHDQRRAARLARHQQKHSASSTYTSSTVTHRHQDR